MAAPLRQQCHTHFLDDGRKRKHVRFLDEPSPSPPRRPSSGPQKPSAEPLPTRSTMDVICTGPLGIEVTWDIGAGALRVKCAEQGSTALHVVGCALTAIQGAPVGEIRDESSYRAVVAKLQQPDRPLHLTFEAPVAPLEEQPHVSVRDHRRWDDDGRQTSRHRHFLYAPSTDATPASARDLLRLYVDEQSTKKRKTKLSEQERAAIRDERDQVRRRRAERRLRKAAARGLHEIIAAALDAGAAARLMPAAAAAPSSAPEQPCQSVSDGSPTKHVGSRSGEGSDLEDPGS